MARKVPLTPQKERKIIAALTEDSHASRVARALGDVSYATVWRLAERAGIELTAGRAPLMRAALLPWPIAVWA
jgi:hypothetical protein